MERLKLPGRRPRPNLLVFQQIHKTRRPTLGKASSSGSWALIGSAGRARQAGVDRAPESVHSIRNAESIVEELAAQSDSSRRGVQMTIRFAFSARAVSQASARPGFEVTRWGSDARFEHAPMPVCSTFHRQSPQQPSNRCSCRSAAGVKTSGQPCRCHDFGSSTSPPACCAQISTI